MWPGRFVMIHTKLLKVPLVGSRKLIHLALMSTSFSKTCDRLKCQICSFETSYNWVELTYIFLGRAIFSFEMVLDLIKPRESDELWYYLTPPSCSDSLWVRLIKIHEFFIPLGLDSHSFLQLPSDSLSTWACQNFRGCPNMRIVWICVRRIKQDGDGTGNR